MPSRQSRTVSLETEEVVDLDDGIFYAPSEITSHYSEDKRSSSCTRIVDLTPQTFHSHQSSCSRNVETTNSRPMAANAEALARKTLRKRHHACRCLPAWMAAAPGWVQFLGFGGFVLAVSSIVFLVVYLFIPWETTDLELSAQPAPEKFYPPEDHTRDLPHRPTMAPAPPTPTVSEQGQWQGNHQMEPILYESIKNSTRTKFPTFAPATRSPT